MPKVTYGEIAHLAGVGTATVERTLNGRGGVRPQTVQKVLAAAKELGWKGQLPDVHRGILRVEVIIVRPETSFYARVGAAFRRIAASLDAAVQIQITYLNENDPKEIEQRINDRSINRAGLIISAPDHPLVRNALKKAIDEGLPVVQMVSRIVPEADLVSIDNYAAGRMAGLMMARLGQVKGAVAAICHSQVYQVHRDRVRGFSDYLAEHGDGLDFRFVIFGNDNRTDSFERVDQALRRWPDLVGVYNAGGANTAVVDVLRRTERDVFFVGHELTDVTRAGMIDGTVDVVFDQIPEAQARRAVDLMLSRLDVISDQIENPPIRFTTVTVENL